MEIISILLLGAICWLWLDSLKAREAAARAAREICKAEGLMLLDDTVSIAGLKPARDDDGNFRLQRVYQFEYSNTGDNRLRGSVVMLGHKMVVFNIGPRIVH